MSQEKLILEFLRENRTGITPMDALNLFGCFRLGARIKALRDAGHIIATEMETHENERGDKKTYARYFLIKEAPSNEENADRA